MTDPASADYRVISCNMVTPVIADVRLAPIAETLAFRAGQYFLLSDTAFRIPPRSYSAADAPRRDGMVRLLVTRVPGGETSMWAARLRPDDEVLLEGPFGTFGTDDRSQPALLLGAGSGLAPVRAIAESIVESGAGRPVILVFSARDRAHRIDHDELTGWAERQQSFRYVETLTRDRSAPCHERVPALLPRIAHDLAGWEVFAAGAPGFVAGCTAAARSLGAAADDIRSEEFFV